MSTSSGSSKQILRSPIFLGALGLLLTNDLLLKDEFHNWITGKLSDIAGLWAVSLFLLAFAPRLKKWIFLGVGMVFVLWKSPLSSGFIEAWSGSVYPIARVVDYSDLIAVAFLPIAYFASERTKSVRLDWSTTVICIISLFAFCATSRRGWSYHYKDEYIFASNPEQVEARIKSFGTVAWEKRDLNQVEFDLNFSTSADIQGEYRSDSAAIAIEIIPENERTVVRLKSITYWREEARESLLSFDHDSFEQKLEASTDIGFQRKLSRFVALRWLENIDAFNLFFAVLCAVFLSLVIIVNGVIFSRAQKPFFKRRTTIIGLGILLLSLLLYGLRVLVDKS
jgi:hypothetical protein